MKLPTICFFKCFASDSIKPERVSNENSLGLDVIKPQGNKSIYLRNDQHSICLTLLITCPLSYALGAFLIHRMHLLFYEPQSHYLMS